MRAAFQSMHPVKRRAAVVSFAAFALAFLTPLYVSYVAPTESVYHRNGMVLLMQTIPSVSPPVIPSVSGASARDLL